MKYEHINVELVDSMGTDLSIVNAARVSFNKQKDVLDGSDERLIKYLAEHNHFTPFCHTAVTVRVRAPLFLARQLVKHQVGLTWNEESRRYVSHEPTFYLPQEWHGRPDGSIKQGAGKVMAISDDVSGMVDTATTACLDTYNNLLALGVAPEEARMVLPLNTMTNWVWTGSVMAFARVFKLRSDSHAQGAAQEFAHKLAAVVSPLFPASWDALTS